MMMVGWGFIVIELQKSVCGCGIFAGCQLNMKNRIWTLLSSFSEPTFSKHKKCFSR